MVGCGVGVGRGGCYRDLCQCHGAVVAFRILTVDGDNVVVALSASRLLRSCGAVESVCVRVSENTSANVSASVRNRCMRSMMSMMSSLTRTRSWILQRARRAEQWVLLWARS